ncbi:hypothetical protein [Microbacterium hibisci]|uniref:hypothetical protein n=1 Tax=Microbacterium hibisci TaxID=2036000 RepID=UPI001944FAE5|nr:hypothetical protein [Microbacterium hibisci]
MTTDDTALGRPYREIRSVRAREDGPWAGLLVRTSGGARVLVDAETVGPDWAGWDAPADGHVLAPLDVARHPAGHHVVLPVCTERVEDFVRRRAGRMPLSLGEAVTLAVSLLRGCGQLALAPETQGEWWLDDSGRPVLATDAASRRARDEAASVLNLVAVEPHAQRTWGTALRALEAERLSVHELTAAEEALFAIATPEPLSTVILSPRSASESAAGTEAAARTSSSHAADPAPSSMWRALIAGVDDDLADTVSRATTAVWRGLRRRESPAAERRRRRAPWLVGGTVAAAVLTGGALWPAAGGVATEDSPAASVQTGAEPPASRAAPTGEAESDAPSDTDATAPSAEAESEASSGGEAPTDLARVTEALLDVRLACAADAACLTGVVVDPAALAPGAVDLPAAQRTVTLLDEFGDLAVLRLDPQDASSTPQMIVILLRDGKWLLRDVYDVAQQP